MRWIAIAVAALSLCFVGGEAQATSQASCDATEARAVLNKYLVAFKRGQYNDLQNLFAAKPDFRWYSVAPPYGRTSLSSSPYDRPAQNAENRVALLSYWRARHAKGETLNVVKFRFALTEERGGSLFAHFNGDLIRKANDLPSERRGFKATLRCGTGATQFIVLSIGSKI